MDDKKIIYLLIGVGGFIGAYLPVLLFKVDGFSLVSIIGGLVGSVLGLYIGYKIITNY